MRPGKLFTYAVRARNDRDSYHNQKSFARLAEDVAIAYLATFAFGVVLVVASAR